MMEVIVLQLGSSVVTESSICSELYKPEDLEGFGPILYDELFLSVSTVVDVAVEGMMSGHLVLEETGIKTVEV